MATTKSIRLNARAESMFCVIKKYYDYRGGISDTEILLNGLEIQYEQVIEDLNQYFKETMDEKLKVNSSALSLFYSISNMLEILSVSEGNTLQDQFYEFLAVNEEESVIYIVDSESKERYSKTSQYVKAWEKVCESERKISGFEQKELDILLESIGKVYRENFPEK